MLILQSLNNISLNDSFLSLDLHHLRCPVPKSSGGGLHCAGQGNFYDIVTNSGIVKNRTSRQVVLRQASPRLKTALIAAHQKAGGRQHKLPHGFRHRQRWNHIDLNLRFVLDRSHRRQEHHQNDQTMIINLILFTIHINQFSGQQSFLPKTSFTISESSFTLGSVKPTIIPIQIHSAQQIYNLTIIEQYCRQSLLIIYRIISTMFEALFQKLLNSILGQYVDNFSKENLSIGIWSGEVILKNLKLKRDIIRKLNLPFGIRYSRLGCLKMNIPWKSLTTSKIEVLLEGLELIIEELPQTEWECKDTKIIQTRKKQLQNYCEGILNDFMKKSGKEKESEDGYFSKLVVKIIDNLQITVRDIHIRYQDHLSNTFSFGVTLEELKLYTVNAKDTPEYIDRNKPEYSNEPLRKRLELYNFGFYWNQKSELYSEANHEQKMGTTIAKRNQTAYHHNYIILMSSQAKLLQRDAGKQFQLPEIDLAIDLEAIKIEITNTQLQQIITLGERMQKYSKLVKAANRHKLSPEDIALNRQEMIKLFPEYCKDWGKSLAPPDLQKLEDILQKMELQYFTTDINKHLQNKQKQRLVAEKKQKNKGWFSGPKDLTPKELEEIEKYLNDNFGQEVKSIERPKDYHHIQLNFRLKKLQIVVANTMAIIKEGIYFQLDELITNFKLREGGFTVQISVMDVGVKLFKQIGIEARQFKNILYKIINRYSQVSQEYLKMVVVSHPLDKQHLDTDIYLRTSELMFIFDPKIISVSTAFANLNISKQNKENAIEKYGELKQITESAVAQSLQKPSKVQIGVNVLINTITVVIPFNPYMPESNCWGITLGNIHLTSDEQTLLRKQILEDLPLQVYQLKLKQFQFRYFNNIPEVEQSRRHLSEPEDVTRTVIEKLDFDLKLSVFHKCTEIIPKIKIEVAFSEVQLKINAFTYEHLVKISDSFEQQEVFANERMSARITEKSQIMSQASKIGVVYIKDSLTRLLWKKYIAVMSENYIYLFINKQDKNYAAYYYIRQADLEKYREPLDKEKPFHFKIKNKINEVVFGFDKEELIDDWMVKIKAQSQIAESRFLQIEAQSGKAEPPKIVQKNHNQLNLLVEASIKSANVRIYTSESTTDKVIEMTVYNIGSQIILYESKTAINLNINSLQLKDNITSYKNPQLAYFLNTSKQAENESLINITIEQVGKKHPAYKQVDSKISVHFGTLHCNYKCETVQTLMRFFVKDSPAEEVQAKIESEIPPTQSIINVAQNEEEVFLLELNLNISEISLFLINQKTKTILGKSSIMDLALFNAMSQKRMILQGSLRQLYYKDYTNYPNTILDQQQSYGEGRYLLAAQQVENKNMLDFDIQILKRPNEHQKTMLITLKLANLTAYYTQQKVFRIITYLNTQLLPSFNSSPKQAPKPLNDIKPSPTPMDLNVQIENISVFLEPDLSKESLYPEYLQLNIQKITVRNQAIYREYVKSLKPVILVENYSVKVTGVSIFIQFIDVKGDKHSYKLTNSLDVVISADLIANPDYYLKQHGKDFDNGLRCQCSMSPFFMRINHDDFNFMMKCLNWNVTHNDGADDFLFDMPKPIQPTDQLQPKNQDNFYVLVRMDCISLFLTHNDVPIVFLLLDGMDYSMQIEENTHMELTITNLYGTVIEHTKENAIHEKGMFNALGYKKSYQKQDFSSIDKLILLFDRRAQLKEKEGQPFLKFKMSTNESKSYINVAIDELIIDIDIKILLTLSNLAQIDQIYTAAPPPVIVQPTQILNILALTHMESKEQTSNQKIMEVVFTMNKLLGSVSDQRKEKFIMLQGAIELNLLNSGERSLKYLENQFHGENAVETVSQANIHARLGNFTLYFCNFRDGVVKAKREILKPMNINTEITSFYHPQQKFIVLETEIALRTEEIVVVVSMKDLKNINAIAQDNLAILTDSQPPKPKEVEITSQQTQQLSQQISNELQTSLKLKGKLKPIQFQLVNDCNNNFMPVLRFIMQESEPFLHKFLIKTQINIAPVISLLFFNPRSSKWEPIVEAFKATIDYLILVTPAGQNTKFLVDTNSEETGSLKINLSTQMISTLLATKEIAFDQQARVEQNVDTFDIEVSPYLFQNLTNESIYLARGMAQFEIPPLFKGPISLENDSEIRFTLGTNSHRFSLDRYGVLKIPKSNYFIQYDSQRVNRIIKFLPPLLIKNCLQLPIFIHRVGKSKQSILKVATNQLIPFDNVDSFSLSLNGNSYTEKAQVNSIKQIRTLLAQKKNFLVLLDHKEKINKFQVIEVRPPYVVYNYLPKQVNLQFILKAKTISYKTIEAQRAHETCISEDIGKFQFKLKVEGYPWTKTFSYKPDRSEEEGKLQLLDEDNGRTVVNYLFSKNKHSGQYSLLLYCKKIIVNQMEDKLIVYGNDAKAEANNGKDLYSLLGGQRKNDAKFNDKVIIVGEEVGNKIRVCGSNSIVDFASPINVGGLGQSQARIVVDCQKQGKQQSLFALIAVQISVTRLSKQSDIFCKKIVIRNRSIVVNNTKNDIVIMEESSDRYKFNVEVAGKKSLIFGMPSFSEASVHGLIFENSQFRSKVVYIPEQGHVYFKLHSKQEGQKNFVYHRIIVKPMAAYRVYELEQVKEEDLPYEIVVKSSCLQVQVAALQRSLTKGDICRFINETPLQKSHELLLQIGYEQNKDRLAIKICPDDLNYRHKQLLKAKKGNLIGNVAIEIYISFTDKKKIINIDEVYEREETKEIEKNYVQIKLNQLVLSINQNSKSVDVPYESMVLTLQKLYFILDETDKKTQYQLRLGFFQIDQAYPHTLSNPVVITPHKFEQFTREKEPKSIFNSIIVINNEFKQHIFIDQIAVDFDDLVVKFSADFINIVTVIVKQFTDIINFKEENYYLQPKLAEWKDLPIPKEGTKIFIKSIKIAPFVIDLSAELKINKLNLQNNQFVSTILSAIGVVMSNIDGAPIVMNGIEITDCIDTVDTITRELIQRYTRDFTSQLYKVFGSLNIIGNPMSLFKNITTGIKDLKDKPAKGFVNGPAEFGIGIAEGTRSLIAHSVGGAFNSLSGITGTVSTGLATLAFDREFQEHREKQKMKKPQNVIQGLSKGGKAIFYGFKEGLTGVFLQPYQSAREGGALGFVKGTAKGLAGLVVKPVTGIIDFASKTTEGIKNQALKFEDKPNEQRMRYPRVFYTECHILREYSLIDSQLLAVLKKVANEQKYSDSIYYDCFAGQGGKEYLIILQSHLVFIDVQKRKILWSMPIEEVEVEEVKKKNTLRFKGRKTSFLRSNQEQVVFNQTENKTEINTIIANLQSDRTDNL